MTKPYPEAPPAPPGSFAAVVLLPCAVAAIRCAARGLNAFAHCVRER